VKIDSADGFVPPTELIQWQPCVRIVPSRFPPIDLFERVADPRDFELLMAVESITNARLRDEVGNLRLVPLEERVGGAGSTWIMAPFTHVSPFGGRFSTGDFGAFYAARSLRTAVEETKYHRGNFLRATNEPPIEIDMRVLHADLVAELHDVRGMRSSRPDLYHKTDYAASQRLAVRLRASGSWGIVYESVRDDGGECVAVLRPKALARCIQAQHLAYVWDGSTITRVYQKSMLLL
jgi:hypothetical protein